MCYKANKKCFYIVKLDMLHVEATKCYQEFLNMDKKFLDESYCNQNIILEDNLCISRIDNIVIRLIVRKKCIWDHFECFTS